MKLYFWPIVATALLLISACSVVKQNKTPPKLLLQEELSQQRLSRQTAEFLSGINPLKNIARKEVIRYNTVQYVAIQPTFTLAKYHRPISLKLDGVSGKKTLALLFDLQNESVSFDASISDSTVTIQLNNMPWLDALEAILNQQQWLLHGGVEGQHLTVHNQQSMNDLLLAQQEALINKAKNKENFYKIQNTKGVLLEPYSLAKFHVYHANIEQLATHLETILSNEYLAPRLPKIMIDTHSNSLLIHGGQSQLDMIQQLIQSLDKKQQQTFIEVIIVSVGDNFGHQLGAQLLIQKKSRQTVWMAIKMLWRKTRWSIWLMSI